MRIPKGAKISAELIFDLSKRLLHLISQDGPTWPCLTMSVAVSDFEDGISQNRALTSFFGVQSVEDGEETHISSKRKHELDEDDVHDRALSRPPPFETQCVLNQVVQADAINIPNNDHSSQESRPGHYRCPKCKQSIESQDVLEHLDWHVAVELQNA